jgi:hypothetical protein
MRIETRDFVSYNGIEDKFNRRIHKNKDWLTLELIKPIEELAKANSGILRRI